MTRSPALYSRSEEIANAATHGLGILLSITALVLLVVYSTLNGNGFHIVSSAIFGASLILLYSMSTVYHLVRKPKWKKLFRALDHSSIFLLIAGTYTPFTLAALGGGWGWTLFGLVWGLAIVGIVIETATGQQYKKLSLTLYIAMDGSSLSQSNPCFCTLLPLESPFLSVVGSATLWELSFTSGIRSFSIMPSGIFLSWVALFSTSSPSSSMSYPEYSNGADNLPSQ